MEPGPVYSCVGCLFLPTLFSLPRTKQVSSLVISFSLFPGGSSLYHDVPTHCLSCLHKIICENVGFLWLTSCPPPYNVLPILWHKHIDFPHLDVKYITAMPQNLVPCLELLYEWGWKEAPLTASGEDQSSGVPRPSPLSICIAKSNTWYQQTYELTYTMVGEFPLPLGIWEWDALFSLITL